VGTVLREVSGVERAVTRTAHRGISLSPKFRPKSEPNASAPVLPVAFADSEELWNPLDAHYGDYAASRCSPSRFASSSQASDF
jgi:hypothetical protein